jgi:dienelactone hydrolase
VSHRRSIALAALLLAMTTAAASCTSTSSQPSGLSSRPGTHTGRTGNTSLDSNLPVRMIVETFVDSSRPTEANGTAQGHPGRKLVTRIFYPSPSPHSSRYPLIVFAHGFGEDPTLRDYTALLRHWASAGYVVAAPVFPLTSSDAPGGPVITDYVNQPADMSFVATKVIEASMGPGNVIDGLVDPSEVGAAGHSLGAVTTLGLVSNSCCLDPRFKAAVIMSGDQETFPGGNEEYGAAPPILLVHGDADVDVPYASSVEIFDSADAPKGLLTIKGGGHDSPVDPTGRAFATVARTTTAFFDVYLKHDASELPLLRDANRSTTKLVFVSRKGSHVRIPVPNTAVGHLEANVHPSSDLSDGQLVTVHWSGFKPGVAINVLQCWKNPPTQASDCNLKGAAVLHPDPKGNGSLMLSVHTGAIGNGFCDTAHNHCVIAGTVRDGRVTDLLPRLSRSLFDRDRSEHVEVERASVRVGPRAQKSVAPRP